MDTAVAAEDDPDGAREAIDETARRLDLTVVEDDASGAQGALERLAEALGL